VLSLPRRVIPGFGPARRVIPGLGPARRVIPGFGPTLGFTLTYLSLLVLIPLAALFLKASSMSWGQFVAALTQPRVLAAFQVSLGSAAAAALVNGVFGLIVAWVLVRYRFPGRGLVDALVDLPFALPTAVAGIALTAIYAETGWAGQVLKLAGIKAAYTPLGIVIALTFIGLPFMVRTVQPVLRDLGPEIEEAAASLGANRWQTFWRVILPLLLPSILTGVALAFARAIGEYGSVVFISGNMPLKTEIVPLVIVTKVQQFDLAGAAAVAVVLLAISFVLLLLINLLQVWAARRVGAA
jgi:sulfate transport system permease protein